MSSQILPPSAFAALRFLVLAIAVVSGAILSAYYYLTADTLRAIFWLLVLGGAINGLRR